MVRRLEVCCPKCGVEYDDKLAPGHFLTELDRHILRCRRVP